MDIFEAVIQENAGGLRKELDILQWVEVVVQAMTSKCSVRIDGSSRNGMDTPIKWVLVLALYGSLKTASTLSCRDILHYCCSRHSRIRFEAASERGDRVHGMVSKCLEMLYLALNW